MIDNNTERDSIKKKSGRKWGNLGESGRKA